jgi:hypothetical protein
MSGAKIAIANITSITSTPNIPALSLHSSVTVLRIARITA